MAVQHGENARFGLIVTILGALVFVPDALIIRLMQANTLDVAIWRGLLAALVTTIGILLFARDAWPGWRVLASGPVLLFILLHGGSSALYLAALGQTSVANTALLAATAPFLAALMSWAALGERIGVMTAICIAVVFGGVAIIASGSLGGGTLFGDALAFLHAGTLAAYYVVLRHIGQRSQLVPAVLGYLVTALLAWPLAPHEALSLGQVGLIAVSGGVILTLGAALLLIGPRYLPAPEVTMITMLEVVAAPILVWAVIGEYPGDRSVLGGAVIFAGLATHTVWRWRRG
jgi:drug/metabolite transporter (DMT)-like permease